MKTNNNSPLIRELTEKYYNEAVQWQEIEQVTSVCNVRIEELKSTSELFKNLILYKREMFLQNPYIKGINIPKIVGDNYILSKERILPSNCIEKYGETTFNLNTFTFNHPFYYCEKYLHFPAIYQKKDGLCWMSVEPFEINSFEKIVQEAHGNVLLFGLGLGYLPYMLSQKDDVNKITVIDIDDEIIRIFQENILYQFENKDKIEIVKASAMDYLKSCDLNAYDYINIDIWKSIHDMLPYYLQALSIARKYPFVQFSYWLESELKCELQRAIIRTAIQQPMNSDFDEFAKHLVKKKINFTRSNLAQLLKLNNFREIMYNFYLEYQSIYDTAADSLASQFVKKPHNN